MTRAEALAFNCGVLAVQTIAERSAASISTSSQTRVHKNFAVVALAELAERGHALLITGDSEQPIMPPKPQGETNR